MIEIKSGDTVYWCVSKCIYSGDVVRVDPAAMTNIYVIDNGTMDYIRLHEQQLYPTRQALIDAQIGYWIAQLGDNEAVSVAEYWVRKHKKRLAESGSLIGEGSKCEHESDGSDHYWIAIPKSLPMASPAPSLVNLDEPKKICKKCGVIWDEC